MATGDPEIDDETLEDFEDELDEGAIDEDEDLDVDEDELEGDLGDDVLVDDDATAPMAEGEEELADAFDDSFEDDLGGGGDDDELLTFGDDEDAAAGDHELDDEDAVREGEFICRGCFMAMRESALADADRMLCRDCA